MKTKIKYASFRLLALGLLFSLLLASTSNGLDEPRYRPPVQVASWQLGVGVKNLRGGCAVTRVLPLSSAKQAGLEIDDIILSVNGVPVGYAGGLLNDLEDELNRQADALGRVNLRVRNGRNGAIVTVPVRLTASNQWQPPVVQPPWWEGKPRPPQGGIEQGDPVRKTLEIFYSRYFARRPDGIGMQNWLTQIAKGMRMEEVHANFLASAEFYDRCQNNEEEWVAQLYLLLAGRRGTGPEIRQWVNTLNASYGGQRLPVARDFLKALGQY